MSSDSTAPISSKSISPLRDNDVLFGRGKGPQYHPGNVAFRALVDSRKADYWSENHEYGDKMQLANEVYDAIVAPKSLDEPGGRFLKQADDMDAVRAEIRAGRSVSTYGGKYYIEVPRKVAVDKCKMALRQKGNPAEQREARRRKRLSMSHGAGSAEGSGPAGAIAAPVSASTATSIGGFQPDLMPSASDSAMMGGITSPFPMMNISPTLSGPSTSMADAAAAVASAAAAPVAAAATSATSPPIHLDSLQLDSDLILSGEDGYGGPTQQPSGQPTVINDLLVAAALEAAQAAETAGTEISHPPNQQETTGAGAAGAVTEHFNDLRGVDHKLEGHAVGHLDPIPLEQMYLPEDSLGSTRTTTASLEDSQETSLSSHSHAHGHIHSHGQGQRLHHDVVSSAVETALLSVQMYRSSVECTAGFDANFLGRTLYDLFIQVFGDEKYDQTAHTSHRGGGISSGGGQDNDIVAEPAKTERRNTDSYQSLAMLGCPVVLSNLIGCLMNQSPSEVFYSSSNEVENDLRDVLLNRNWENEASEVGGGQLCFDENQIFGRDDEVSILFSAYDRVVRERRESHSFLAISGYSGTGKTSLVKQLGSRFLADNVSLIRCNFTAQGQSMSVLFQAFDDYCRVISGRDRNLFDGVRRDVKEALGLQSGILLRCLPNLRSLLGESVDSPTMTAETKEEEMNRVLFYFIKFVEAISSPEHPIVVVFDDIQWCDESCLDLVRLILRNTEITSALFIGCYRDENVINDDPFGKLFGELNMEASLPMSSIRLTNLSTEGVNEFVSSALRLNKRFTRPLAQVLHRKTQGNPIFVRHLLLSLTGDGLLNFSVVDRRWQWNIEAISAKSIANSSVSLMVGMMKTHQQSDQDALRLAALLGTKFKLEILERLFV